METVLPHPIREDIPFVAPPVLATLPEYVDMYARQTPQRAALSFNGTEMGYAELLQRADRLGRALTQAGLQPGERVAVLSTPRPEFLVALLAIMKVGLVYVGLNPRYTARELIYVLEDARPAAVLSLASFEGRDHARELASLLPAAPWVRQAWRLDDGPGVDTLQAMASLLAGADELPDAAWQARCAAVDPADPAVIVYTSGSTGQPKGAVLPHRSLVSSPRNALIAVGLSEPSAVCDLPTNHVACLGDLCASILIGGGLIVFQQRFDAAHLLEAIETHRLTNLMHTPTVLQLLLQHPDIDRRDLSSLRIVAWGGATMPLEAIREWRRRVGRLMVVYGMTETVCNVTWADERCSDEQLAKTIGFPGEGIEMRLVNDAGEPAPDGQPGEIQVRYTGLMLGYHGRSDATAAAFTADGFLRTGDVATRQSDGSLQLVGRRSEMFKSGGYNVYPREIEMVLEQHPALALAAVVSVSDPVFHEVGHAWLMLEPGQTAPREDQLKAFCREHLANYKIPKRFHVCADLPLLPVGKVDKVELRRRSTTKANP